MGSKTLTGGNMEFVYDSRESNEKAYCYYCQDELININSTVCKPCRNDKKRRKEQVRKRNLDEGSGNVIVKELSFLGTIAIAAVVFIIFLIIYYVVNN